MLKGIGTRIKELREEHELTMDMLVQDINGRYELENPLNKGMVSRWERDVNNPSLDSARCLCDYFNVSLDWRIFESIPISTLFHASYHTLFSDKCHY